MGASFGLPLGSYTGIRSLLLWAIPNLGCTPSQTHFVKRVPVGYTVLTALNDPLLAFN